MAQSYANTHPGQVLYYMADDYANTSCSSLSAWATANGMGGSNAFFSNSAINMSDYGIPGMPKVVVVGCSEHKVYYNKNYTAAGIGAAIDEALEDCMGTSTNEYLDADLKLELFPNPAQRMTTVSFEMTESMAIAVDVLNMVGESVLNIYRSTEKAGLVQLKFNSERLGNGIYFLRVQSKKGIQVAKFTVKH